MAFQKIIPLLDVLVCLECQVAFSRRWKGLIVSDCPQCTQHSTVLPLTDELINKHLRRLPIKEG
jgi:hypothetical protein